MLASLFAGLVLSVNAYSVSESEMAGHLRYLVSPELEGRLTGSKGQDLAATYIENHFKKVGLKPFKDGSYIHTFEVNVNQRPGKNNSLSFTGPGAATLTIETDYMPLAGTANAKPVDAGLVYVGYGLAEEGWDDYSGVDVKGKVVLAFRGVPEGKQNVSNTRKARTASEKGAVGIIFVGPSAAGGAEFPRTNRSQGVPSSLEMVAAGVHSKYFKGLTGLDFAAAKAAKAPASKVLGSSIKITTELERGAGSGRNIIGILPGNDPVLKDEFIIVGGHYDHLGFGEIGSRTNSDAMHAGADDNGSGTAAVLSLASAMSQWKTNRRTIMFHCWSGEEVGLVGSNAFCRDFPEILAKTSATLNMDMIGTVRQNNVYVFGLSSSQGWKSVLDQVKVADLNLVTAEHVRGDSDQASFARRNVPVLFWHTGLTNEYHSEKDTFDMVNLKGAVKVANAAPKPGHLLAPGNKLEFDPKVVLGNKPDDRRVPPPDPKPEETPAPTERRIRVGFIPDYNAGGPGAAISGSVPGSPADKAGLKGGDRITEFNGKAVTDIETLNDAMKTAKPGDKVKIKFLRDGKEMTVEITVEERDGVQS